jgi:alpha-amylase
MLKQVALALAAVMAVSGGTVARAEQAPVDPFWRNATVYFLMTDRFANGDPGNDQAAGRKHDGDLLRSYEGGDIRGVIRKIEQGYFTRLGVDAIWTTPLIENVHGSVGEGQWGKTYAYHGYWPLDWTAVDPNMGNEADFAAMVAAAHRKGIRVIVDVIANHSGPETAVDPRWPADWVRATPPCDYKSYAGSVSCELSFTLQDMRTESESPVALPAFLIDKWRREGRLAREQAELDAFFARTGYPRAPKYHLVKWLTDWVRDYGVDGFRVDTAKHVDADVWEAVRREADLALADWRKRHPRRIAGDKPFYMVGEVFNYGLLDFSNARGRAYDYGDRTVDFYDHGFDALINMGFASQLAQPLPELYARYDAALGSGDFRGRATLNYLASHDDMGPHDPARQDIWRSAAQLLLAPGGAQIYYGDEIGRSLIVPGTKGDTTLRSVYDWRAAARPQTRALMAHWQRLGRFRQRHLAIGAGRHVELALQPFTFARTLDEGALHDRVVIAMDLGGGAVSLPVGNVFSEGSALRDAYSGQRVAVHGGKVSLAGTGSVVLLETASGR